MRSENVAKREEDCKARKYQADGVFNYQETAIQAISSAQAHNDYEAVVKLRDPNILWQIVISTHCLTCQTLWRRMPRPQGQ